MARPHDPNKEMLFAGHLDFIARDGNFVDLVDHSFYNNHDTHSREYDGLIQNNLFTRAYNAIQGQSDLSVHKELQEALKGDGLRRIGLQIEPSVDFIEALEKLKQENSYQAAYHPHEITCEFMQNGKPLFKFIVTSNSKIDSSLSYVRDLAAKPSIPHQYDGQVGLADGHKRIPISVSAANVGEARKKVYEWVREHGKPEWTDRLSIAIAINPASKAQHKTLSEPDCEGFSTYATFNYATAFDNSRALRRDVQNMIRKDGTINPDRLRTYLSNANHEDLYGINKQNEEVGSVLNLTELTYFLQQLEGGKDQEIQFFQPTDTLDQMAPLVKSLDRPSELVKAVSKFIEMPTGIFSEEKYFNQMDRFQHTQAKNMMATVTKAADDDGLLFRRNITLHNEKYYADPIALRDAIKAEVKVNQDFDRSIALS